MGGGVCQDLHDGSSLSGRHGGEGGALRPYATVMAQQRGRSQRARLWVHSAHQVLVDIRLCGGSSSGHDSSRASRVGEVSPDLACWNTLLALHCMGSSTW